VKANLTSMYTTPSLALFFIPENVFSTLGNDFKQKLDDSLKNISGQKSRKQKKKKRKQELLTK
jgi:hypothetical protein